MIKFAFIMVATILTGCATLPPPHPDHVQCDQIGVYARGIETLKQIGVKNSDVTAYTTQPVVATFPMQRVRTLVYQKTFGTPADTYTYFYEMCTTVGYTNMMAALDKAEQQEIKDLTPVTPPAAPKPVVRSKKVKR